MKNKIRAFRFFGYAIATLLSFSFAQARIDTTATWTFKTGGPVYSSPTSDNGFVYIGSDDGKMYCLEGESGLIKWTFETGGLIRCKPAIVDTFAYFESDDGNLYAVNKNSGTKIWNLDIGNNITRILPNPNTSYWDYMQSSPCVDSGSVYAGSGDGYLYSVNAQTGSLHWKTKTGDIIRSSPCVYQSYVYVGSNDGYIYALNKTDGSIAWKYNTASGSYKRVINSPRIYNGTVYCGSRSGYFNAIDAITGTLKWNYFYSSNYPMIESSAAIENGIVYVGSSDLRKVFAFDAATGKIVWNSAVPGDTWSSPFFKSGTLYIGLATYGNFSTKNSGALLAIDASTGKIEWRLNSGTTTFIGGVVSSPTVDDHMIYYGSLDSMVYAVDTAFTNISSGVQGVQNAPKTFQLNDNYPNPFNPVTTIEYQVSTSSHMTLRIFNILGKEVQTLVDGIQKPGSYRVTLDGSHLSSGVYFDRLSAGNYSETKTLLLIK
jgi:eukaryotic-like serine/threonine-protein kinase